MIRLVFSSLALLLAGCTSVREQNALPQAAASAVDNASERDIFDIWISARAGDGTPVHWVSEGAVYAYPTGEKLFGMTGFDSSRVIGTESEDGEIMHLTRKTFAYTDAATGEILTEYNGEQVVPIAYPYQIIRYRMKDDLIFASVEQGAEPRIQQIETRDGITSRKVGDSWAFTAPLFLNFPLPNGDQYEAWENYDFFVHPEGSVGETHQMTWQRFGDLPPWAGGGKAIYHLLSWRVESVEDFPPPLLEWAKAEKPMWLTPPENIEEIRRLQKGEGGPGWGQ